MRILISTSHPFQPDCRCEKCIGHAPRPHEHKADRIERVAAEMRAYYLTHGTGCKSRLRAIEQRAGAGV